MPILPSISVYPLVHQLFMLTQALRLVYQYVQQFHHFMGFFQIKYASIFVQMVHMQTINPENASRTALELHFNSSLTIVLIFVFLIVLALLIILLKIIHSLVSLFALAQCMQIILREHVWTTVQGD